MKEATRSKSHAAIKEICFIATFLALLIVGSFITVNTGYVKFTLQLLVIFLIGLLAPLRISMAVIFIYVVTGLLGLPIFAGFLGGFAQIYSPTFGFVYGFIPGLLVMGLFKIFLLDKTEKKWLYVIYAMLSCLACTIIVYFFGTLHGYVIMNVVNNKGKDFAYILSVFILPYIPFDALKLALAVSVSLVLKKYVH